MPGCPRAMAVGQGDGSQPLCAPDSAPGSTGRAVEGAALASPHQPGEVLLRSSSLMRWGNGSVQSALRRWMGSALCTVLKAVISANGSFAGDIQIATTPFSLQILPHPPHPPPISPPREEDKGSSLQSPSKAAQAEEAQLPGTISPARGRAQAERAADTRPGCLQKKGPKQLLNQHLGERTKLPCARSRCSQAESGDGGRARTAHGGHGHRRAPEAGRGSGKVQSISPRYPRARGGLGWARGWLRCQQQPWGRWQPSLPGTACCICISGIHGKPE